jgi:8-oxo-dGTP pyrophosphatase MutT (NUDIX family)
MTQDDPFSLRRGGQQVIPRPAGARPGPPAPWPSRQGPITLAEVKQTFVQMGPPGPPTRTALDGATLPSRRPSAVLCALFEEDGEARVVLTRRSQAMRSHTGQVSFPGGRLEPGELALDAALREAAEEVGLDPAVCQVLGELSPLVTISTGTGISPFVVALPGRPVLRPNPVEVERAFDVALSELARPDVYREEIWPMAEGERSMYIFDLEDDAVWGATARMLTELLDLVLGVDSDPGRAV